MDDGAVGVVDLEVERVGARTEQLGQHARGGLHLRVAVVVGLHDVRVHAERHVVHEHVAVHRREVDRALEAVLERVEGADDVVAVDTEVEREVVAGAGRDAHERQAVLARDPGDEGLGTVATGHPQHVGAPRDRVAASAARSSPGSSTTGSIPRCSASRTRSNFTDLAAARPRVHQQDGPLRLRNRETGRRHLAQHRIVDARPRSDRAAAASDHTATIAITSRSAVSPSRSTMATAKPATPTTAPTIAGDALPGQRDPARRSTHQRRDPRREELPGMVDEREQDRARRRHVAEQRDHRGNLTTAQALSHRRPFRTRSLVANQPGIGGQVAHRELGARSPPRSRRRWERRARPAVPEMPTAETAVPPPGNGTSDAIRVMPMLTASRVQKSTELPNACRHERSDAA